MFVYNNKIDKPKYFDTVMVNDWFRKFNNLLINVFNLSSFLLKDNIYITFSYEELKEEYGSFSVDEIIDIIKNKYNINKDIEEKLRNLKNDNDHGHCDLEIISSEIYKLNPEIETSIYSELKNLFKNILNEFCILGRYYPGNREIVLYITSIEEYAKKYKLKNIEVIEQTFIHELFHAYHYKDDDEEIWNRCDYTSKVIKESLASFFEYVYCEKNNVSNYLLISDSWYINKVYNYPYSGAIHIVDAAMFSKIYKVSKYDFDDALRKLFINNKYDFYEVKNIIFKESVKSKVSKKVHIINSNGLNITESDLYRKILKSLKVGKIANIYFREILNTGNITSIEFNKFITEKGVNSIFGLSQPILSMVRKDDKGYDRCYSKKITAFGGIYYLNCQWGEEHKDKLIDWIIKWMEKNVF